MWRLDCAENVCMPCMCDHVLQRRALTAVFSAASQRSLLFTYFFNGVSVTVPHRNQL